MTNVALSLRILLAKKMPAVQQAGMRWDFKPTDFTAMVDLILIDDAIHNCWRRHPLRVR